MGKADESLYTRELSGGYRSLRFQQPLEREFRAHYVGQNAPRLRATLMLGLAFVLTLALLDWQLGPAGAWQPSMMILLGIVSPALLVGVVATYPGFLARYLAWFAVIAGATMAGGAFALAWLSLQASPALALSSLVATTGFVYLMLGLRLPTALWLGLPLLLGYLLLGLSHELTAQRFAYELTVLAFANITGAYGCYRLEHAARTSFLEREIVNILAGSDALTGIPNRRMFSTHLQRVWRQAVRESRRLAVAIVEVDHFEDFAGRYGQQAADMTFRRVAHAVMNCARRPFDFSARFSDKEFALVLYDPDLEYVDKLAARVRDQVALLDIPHEASPVSERLTVSIGVATSAAGGKDDPKDLLELADLALTEVTQRGRNAVVVKEAAAEGSRVLKGPWESSGV